MVSQVQARQLNGRIEMLSVLFGQGEVLVIIIVVVIVVLLVVRTRRPRKK